MDALELAQHRLEVRRGIAVQRAQALGVQQALQRAGVPPALGKVPRGELAQLVRARQAEHPDTPVLIAADKNVRYEAVLNVMDELQRERIRRVGLLVKPAQ